MQMKLKRNAKSVVKLIGLIFETTNSVASKNVDISGIASTITGHKTGKI